MSSTWALVPPSRRHFRDESFHVRYSDSEVARLATEIHEQTIADVHLSLFTYWISEHKSHYEQARVQIRELGLDQGYPTSRIENVSLRKLLDDTKSSRPSPPYFANNLTARGSLSRKTSAPPTIRSDSTASSTQREVAPWSPFSPSRAFPPDTPDRPAPLTIRSKGSSGNSSATWTAFPRTALPRSVSTPIRAGGGGMAQSRGFERIPARVMQATASLAAMSMGNMDLDEEVDEWESQSEEDEERAERMYRMSAGTADLRTVFSGAMSSEEDIEATPEAEGVGAHVDDAPTTAIMTPPNAIPDHNIETETETGSVSWSDTTATTPTKYEQQAFVNTGVRPTTYPPSSVFDSHPNHAFRSQYALSNPRSRLYTFNTGPAPTPSQRSAAAQARRRTRELESRQSAGSTGDANRPLPFRNLTHNFSSVGNTTSPDLTRHASLSTPTANEPYASRRYNTPTSNGTSSSTLRRYDSEASLPAFRAHLVTSAVAPSPARSGNSTQIQGLEELTMRVGPNALRTRSGVSRATSRMNLAASREAERVASEAARAIEENKNMGDRFKALSAAYVNELLSETRARGARLPNVEVEDLGPFELAWREDNAALLDKIYGRKDMVMGAEEKELVDRIARSVADGTGRLEEYGWVGGLLI